jgi:hypothetical protein
MIAPALARAVVEECHSFACGDNEMTQDGRGTATRMTSGIRPLNMLASESTNRGLEDRSWAMLAEQVERTTAVATASLEPVSAERRLG